MQVGGLRVLIALVSQLTDLKENIRKMGERRK